MSCRRAAPILALAFLMCAASVSYSQPDKKTGDPKPAEPPTVPSALTKDVAEAKQAAEKAAAELSAAKKELDTLAKELAAVKAAALEAKKVAETATAEAKGAKAGIDAATKASEEVKNGIDEAKKTAEETKAALGKAETGVTDATRRGDTAWMLVSSALVMLMVPGLALFYGGMVRRKNVLGTMMQSMAALAVVGVYWIAVGYSLAFGPPVVEIPKWEGSTLFGKSGGVIGWSWGLFFLKDVAPSDYLPGLNIPVYLHVMFQGMFAILTPALISGAVAERIRFWPFCIFMILWVTFVYCPLAHMVWSFDWFINTPAGMVLGPGSSATGYLGKMGALDFAGGTVVHIAAGAAGLACALVLGRRTGYPDSVFPPNSMVLTVTGAALLWFGWFGFNGGSSVASNSLAVSAFAATQAAAAAAGLSWIVVEWLVKGKPTGLGLASGFVAGLVAVTPASGFVPMWAGVIIGLIAGAVCYFAVSAKTVLGYDDSLDAFGVHCIGGFAGAILTGFFCYTAVNGAGSDGYFAFNSLKADADALTKQAEKLEELKKSLEAKVEKPASAKKDLEEKLKPVDALVADLTAQVEKAAEDAKKDLETKLAEAKTKKDELDGEIKKITEEIKPDEDQITLYTAAIDTKKAEAKRLNERIESMKSDKKDAWSQVTIQTTAAVGSLLFAFFGSLILAVLVQILTLGNFATSKADELEGLDITEHGEHGFDFGVLGATSASTGEPKAAIKPPNGVGRFTVIVDGVSAADLARVWSDCCQPSKTPPMPEFQAIYPYVTTVQGTRFRFRAGQPDAMCSYLQQLLQKKTGNSGLRVRVEA